VAEREREKGALDFWPPASRSESKLGGTARCHWAKALRVRYEVPKKNYALGTREPVLSRVRVDRHVRIWP